MVKHLSFLQALPLALLGLLLNLTPTWADSNLETGYYYITNAYDETRALWGRYPYLGWNTLDKTHPGFVFYLEKAPTETNNYGETVTDNYYMQCLDYSAWFYGVPYGYVTTLTKDKGERQTVRFAKLSNGNYSFQPTTVRKDFINAKTPQYNCFGVETNSKQFTYGVKALHQTTSESTVRQWKITKLTDDELQMVLNNQLSQALMQAYATYTATTASILGTEGLITNGTSTDAWGTGSQFFGPEETSASIERSATGAYSCFAYLIDGDMGTRYQSNWQASVHAAPQFLQVDLGEDKTVNAFRLHYGKRYYWPSRSVWRDITLYATNDASIALDQTASTKTDIAANSSWHKIGSYRFPTDQIVYSTAATVNERTVEKYYQLYTDERYIDVDFAWPGDAYRYLRFYVDEPLIYNSSTGKDFTLNELQIYERTEPAVVHSKQAEAKALLSAISAAESKLSASTATKEDITTLQAAIDKVSEEASVSITEIGYSTFVSDENLKLADGLEAYIVTAQDGSKATLYKIAGAGQTLPANTPVLIKGAKGDYVLPVSTEDAVSVPNGNLLDGAARTITTQADGTTYYTLQNNNGTAVFKKYKPSLKLKAGYAYLPVTSTSGSPAFLNLSFDAATGIQGAVNSGDVNNAKTYDLEGRSVKHPQKGIYIRGGKKVIIK